MDSTVGSAMRTTGFGIALGVVLSLVTPQIACAQAASAQAPSPQPSGLQQPDSPQPATPPPATPNKPATTQKPSSATDIGVVTTRGGGGQQGAQTVTPSATTTRAAALEEKKESPTIVDVQPLSEIKKLPDINTAEALQRIPGISLETDSGEGRFINIRGLDSDLNAATYGGVPLPVTNQSSPFSGARAVAFDVIPTGIIGGIEVSKTLAPYMDASGLGGSINLVPRTGAEHGGALFFDADLGGGYEKLRQTPAYHAEFSTGRSFSGGDGIGGQFAGDNAFSAVITAVYHQDQRGVDDVEESYADQQSSGVPDKVLSNLQMRRYLYARKRYGAAANFDAKANDATSLYARVFYSGYTELAHKHYLVLNNLYNGCTPLPTCVEDPNDPNGFVAPGGAQLSQQTTDSLERVQNTMAILGGQSLYSGFRLDYHASYALGSDRFSWSPGSEWDDPNPVPLAYDSNSNADFPRFQTLNGVNPADPANYLLNNVNFGPSYAKDQEWTGAINFTKPTGSGDHIGEWKFGLAARIRHQTSESSSFTFTPYGNISLAPYTYGPSQVYYQGNYNIGPMINLFSVSNLGLSNLGQITEDPAADAAGTTDDTENVYAAYGQFSGRWGKWGLLAGVRVEQTRADYSGNLYNNDTDTNTPASESVNYTNAFPTVQGRYYFSDELVGRLTYATGIARPGFNQITPGASVSVVNASVTVGNPNLKPTIGQNFDATLEWYPGNGQIAALGLFDKQFSNYNLLSQKIQQGYPYPGLENLSVVVQTYTNGPGWARGLEAQYQQQFVSLPQPWNGFGYSANVTAVDSHAQIHPAIPASPGNPAVPAVSGLLPSTSRLTWNAAVFYETERLELRLAADYVGQNLFAFGSVGGNATDTYSTARLTMDFGASYAIAHSVRLYFDAKNLLNTPLEFTEGPSQFRPIQREFYDATFFGGVRMSFN